MFVGFDYSKSEIKFFDRIPDEVLENAYQPYHGLTLSDGVPVVRGYLNNLGEVESFNISKGIGGDGSTCSVNTSFTGTFSASTETICTIQGLDLKSSITFKWTYPEIKHFVFCSCGRFAFIFHEPYDSQITERVKKEVAERGLNIKDYLWFINKKRYFTCGRKGHQQMKHRNWLKKYNLTLDQLKERSKNHGYYIGSVVY